MNTLKIKDYIFTIKSASIKQKIDKQGDFLWDIDIETESKEIDNVFWAPKIYGDQIKVIGFDLNNIVGKEIKIKEPYDPITEDYLICIYIFEHEDVWDSTIKFLAKKENKLLISWEGKCNIHWNDEYCKNVPFKIETEILIED